MPLVRASLDASAEVQFGCDRGPGVLLTHGCEMDKANKDGAPRVEWLQFTRLRSLTMMDSQAALNLKRGKLGPFSMMYAGEWSGLGEAWLLLSDSFPIPAAFFDPFLSDHAHHPKSDQGDRYLTPGRNDDRIGRLSDESVTLLTDKMGAFWTRTQPE